MDPTMSPDLTRHFEELDNEFVWLCIRWVNYRQLFAVSADQTDLLNRAAPAYFGTTQRILEDDLLIGVCRLTDGLQAAGRDNLVLDRLIVGLNPSTDSSLMTDLRNRLMQVNTAAAPLRLHRNRRVAHVDLNAAIAPLTNPLPPYSRQTLGDALSLISEFLNRFRAHFGLAHCMYLQPILGLGDAAYLVSILRRVRPPEGDADNDE
jgi:hypothetical protein